MTWEFHPAPGAFAQYAADWDRLNGELYDSHPYFDSRFVGPLLKYFASGNELLCLYRERGIVRGALILQPRGAGRWATFRPAQAQITPILVADAGLLKNLLEALPGFAWTIEFHAVDPRYAPAILLHKRWRRSFLHMPIPSALLRASASSRTGTSVRKISGATFVAMPIVWIGRLVQQKYLALPRRSAWLMVFAASVISKVPAGRRRPARLSQSTTCKADFTLRCWPISLQPGRLKICELMYRRATGGLPPACR